MPPALKMAVVSQDTSLHCQLGQGGFLGRVCLFLCPDPGHIQTSEDLYPGPVVAPPTFTGGDDSPAIKESCIFLFKSPLMLTDNYKKPKNCSEVQNL